MYVTLRIGNNTHNINLSECLDIVTSSDGILFKLKDGYDVKFTSPKSEVDIVKENVKNILKQHYKIQNLNSI